MVLTSSPIQLVELTDLLFAGAITISCRHLQLLRMGKDLLLRHRVGALQSEGATRLHQLIRCSQ